MTLIYSRNSYLILYRIGPLEGHNLEEMRESVEREDPSQAPQGLGDPLVEQMTNVECRVSFKCWIEMTVETNREVLVYVNSNLG